MKWPSRPACWLLMPPLSPHRPVNTARALPWLQMKYANWAERTSSSTREIATVVNGVQEETRRPWLPSVWPKPASRKVYVFRSIPASALEKIVSGVQKASIQVREIARATVEQAMAARASKRPWRVLKRWSAT